MRLVIDYSVCTGNGRCYALHPDLFSDDERGYGQVIGDGHLAEERREDSERIARCCPEQAIVVQPDDATEGTGAIAENT